MDTGISTGDTPSSEPEAHGTRQPPRQQMNNAVGTSQFQSNREVYVGCNIINQRREVKDGQESSSPKTSRLEDLYTVRKSTDGDAIRSEAPGPSQQRVTYSQPGPMNYSGPGASSGIVNNQQNTTYNFYSKNEGYSSSQTSEPVDIDKLDCTELKDYYSTTLCKASPLPWYPEYTWDIDEVYTELALEKSKTSKFGVEGLFEQWDKHNSKGGSYRILIEGDAGYGKSTLMLKIASDWSKSARNNYTSRFSLLFCCKSAPNDYTSRFSLLFVVKLGCVGEDKNFLSYMEEFYKEQIDTPLKNVFESKRAEVLVLLDGYDEANATTKKEVDLIMKRETMSNCHVVLTSRCGHVPDHVKRIAMPVRVTGFGPRQVADAVGKFFNKTDKPLSLEQFNEFMEKLRAENPYKELAQCPLLCVMMCCLVSDCPNELPSTVSGLYFAMINRNLYHAARKKTRTARKGEKQWNWDVLCSQIREGHESYLQDFGRLCINGLKTRSMSFTLFEITGNEEEAETTDVKVAQLIEAGVLVQDTKIITNEKISRYQVPHRTTAEFLAAYSLSRETDQNLCQQNLLDLYRLRASFDEVAASLIEMGKTRLLAKAFHDVKFPDYCLTSFMESYFLEHGAAGTWMEFKDALPNKLYIYIVNTSETVTVSSAEPNETLLHLCEVLGKGNTRETNARPSDCLVSVHMGGDFNPELLQTLSKSGVGLERLVIYSSFAACWYGSSEVTRILQELLKSHSCPVQLSFYGKLEDSLLAVTEAMQEVPEGCRLKSFHFSPFRDDVDASQLEKVLAEKWLSHLQHLGLEYKHIGDVIRTIGFSRLCNPKLSYVILKRLREPGCSLTSLHLSYYCKLDFEDLMMLASKLETLSLFGTELDFNVTEISKYAVKERCSLKSLRLDIVFLNLEGSLPSVDENQELLRGWRNVALNLEELTIDYCKFPIELFSWLNLSLPKLRTVNIGKIEGRTPNGDIQPYANQVLEALTRSSGESIEELSLLRGFWGYQDKLMLHPIREALQRCPKMKSINLGYYPDRFDLAASIGSSPSSSLSPSDEEAFRSDNISALLKILSVPKIQTLTSGYFFNHPEEIGIFHAIADKAEKWPGKTNDNDCTTSLTLRGLSNENAVNAMHVFRERGLEYRLRYVEEHVYELWFPPRVVAQFQGV